MRTKAAAGVVSLVLLALLVGCPQGGIPVLVVEGLTSIHSSDIPRPIASGTSITFGTVRSGDGQDYEEMTFTIRNTGTGDLHLTGISPVQIVNDAHTVYSVPQQPEPVIAPETTTDFIIRLTSDVSHEAVTAEAQIATNDPDVELFTLALTGVAS
jgi:hypothetical protein